ncbi:hypothetical protein A2Z33_01235 [Candidatus Gottesmanbacteria bacterium RBG_16_52_11]|uniref:Peptidase C39 domain-containing protein n=1 Tax=Candidatus Gottesmanbacteria bacterium RBG_16_52_11 TaxID=1798374 RepID=A0A1F5YPE3_9BACT|nr:MAG: hypothetical protein A2Z33_01235 [Candidatus Gottesmanbacteria bacterium RBG_16_52_11]
MHPFYCTTDCLPGIKSYSILLDLAGTGTNPYNRNPADFPLMGRSRIKPVLQPDDVSCGPATVKHVMAVFNRRRSISSLSRLCRTNGNGTNTKNMIRALRRLGFYVSVRESATLSDVKRALRRDSRKQAAIVSYLAEDRPDRTPDPDSGHWGMVAGFSPKRQRISILDSSVGARRTYRWDNFRQRWYDYDLKRNRSHARSPRFRVRRQWQPHLLMVASQSIPDNPGLRQLRTFSPL